MSVASPSTDLRYPPTRKPPQSGSVLAVTLLILLTMTLLALAASHVTKTQTRVATASQEQDQAFQHAEAALRAGEQVALSAGESPPCSIAPCRIYAAGSLDGADVGGADLEWWSRHSLPASEQSRALPASQGRFIVERIEEIPDSLAIDPRDHSAATYYFRVSAVGISDSGQPRVVLQSVVAQRASL